MKDSSPICVALTAHVDAGKTTLSESILLNTGVIRTAGRVDHGDSFLDHDGQERERGITIYSKQFQANVEGKQFVFMDTPGHVDFSAEMERVLSVLDYAVLIISAPDGIHGHDLTLWKLFRTYQIPVFVFVNKMDQPGSDRRRILQELAARLGEGFVDFTAASAGPDAGGDIAGGESRAAWYESIAVLDDGLTERYLETGEVSPEEIRALIRRRKLFPCCFGSALKGEGVSEFLHVLGTYSEARDWPDTFSARIFKISRDSRGNRLTHVRVTGGVLRPKDTVRIYGPSATEDTYTEEKAEQILLPSGGRAEQLQEARAGMVVAVSGLGETRAGGTLGRQDPALRPLMVPLFTSRIIPPEDMDLHRLYLICRELEEEIPEIHVEYEERSGELRCQLMGPVQTDVLKTVLEERKGVRVEFAPASIVYKETVTAPVYCAGHYEPLKHYAEVHLLLEPLERGSGVEITSALSEDVLPRHFQRLIMTNAAEKKHRGVLTGGELTDVRITLVNAAAHEKHTEGGDFRQAVYRAVRQGLMKARALGQCRLLEPYYEYELRVPDKDAGRAMTDLGRIAETMKGPELAGGEAVFTGRAPVSAMQGYDETVLSYTRGFGTLQLIFGGYDDCRDQETVLAGTGYDPDLDLEEPSGSVFCSHGAGYYVPWDETDACLHLPRAAVPGIPALEESAKTEDRRSASRDSGSGAKEDTDYLGSGLKADKELEEIFRRHLSGNRRADKKEERRRDPQRSMRGKPAGADADGRVSVPEPLRQYLLVDGYNMIFAWKELKELAALNIDAARTALMDILANYQGYKGMTLILVFDAYKVRGGRGSIERWHNIYVVYTREAQTADAYIEAAVHEIGKKYRVTVATSDGLEQTIVFGEGAARMSARELQEAVEESSRDIFERYITKYTRLPNRIQMEDPDPGDPAAG